MNEGKIYIKVNRAPVDNDFHPYKNYKVEADIMDLGIDEVIHILQKLLESLEEGQVEDIKVANLPMGEFLGGHAVKTKA